MQEIMPDKQTGVCSHCGRPLPLEAAFCPWCETSQNEPQEITLSRISRRKGTGIGLLLLLACIFAAGVIYWYRISPRDYRGGVSVVYTLKGQKCRLILSFNKELKGEEEKLAAYKDELPEGNQAAVYSRLFLRTDSGNDLREEFTENIKEFKVTTVPRDGAVSMRTMESELRKEETGQIGETHVVYGPENGTNDICWDLTMKNGDTIHLEHTMTCELMPDMEVHYEDTPLNTMADIEAVLEEVMENAVPKTVPVLYLPPIEYEGELTLDRCTAKFIGSTEGEKRTTFTGTVTVKTRSPILTDLNNISFEGHGGIGLAAEEGVIVTDCSFRGYDIAADARDGSWIILESCQFEGNGTGFRFASGHATCSSPWYYGLRFVGNDVGIEIRQVPRNTPLELVDCVFENNGTDVVDPDGLVSGY